MNNDSIDILAEHLMIDASFLRNCLEAGALTPADLTDDPLAVSPGRLARIRRLQRLCVTLEVDEFAGAIIVDLLEQLDDARRELEGR